MTRASHSKLFRGLASLPAALLVTASMACAQEHFTSTEAAANALVNAAGSGNAKAILKVLGREASSIVTSGDPVADKTARLRFVEAYGVKHQLTMDGDAKAVLVIGQEDFPFPIPLIREEGMWQFDAAAGRQEILYRRIGRNELDAVQACLAYVDAQNEYADKDRTGAGLGMYAQRIMSSPGKKDGLYWPDTQGNDESPLGELAAKAATEGYRVGAGRVPYHGYYYKILTRQGPAAGGGALDYVVNGKMIGGFALVAYPAEYRNSGVKTFIVNYSGAVYEKDLGSRTAEIASRMMYFNPDNTWQKVDTLAPLH